MSVFLCFFVDAASWLERPLSRLLALTRLPLPRPFARSQMYIDNEEAAEDDNYFIRILQHAGQRPQPMRSVQLPPVVVSPPKVKGADVEE